MSDSDSIYETMDIPLNPAELHSFTQVIQSLEENLSETIQRLHRLKKKVHDAEHNHHQDLYKSTGLRDFLHSLLPLWKEQGRLSTSGFLVRLIKEEKIALNLDETEEWISIYEVAQAFISHTK